MVQTSSVSAHLSQLVSDYYMKAHMREMNEKALVIAEFGTVLLSFLLIGLIALNCSWKKFPNICIWNGFLTARINRK